jgi:hypothetical protein
MTPCYLGGVVGALVVDDNDLSVGEAQPFHKFSQAVTKPPALVVSRHRKTEARIHLFPLIEQPASLLKVRISKLAA